MFLKITPYHIVKYTPRNDGSFSFFTTAAYHIKKGHTLANIVYLNKHSSEIQKVNIEPVKWFSGYFTWLSSWVSTAILLSGNSGGDLDVQANIITKFIKIAKNLRNLNNFQAVAAIIAGLKSQPISRLKSVWKKVQKRIILWFTQLGTLISVDDNFKVYRESILSIKDHGALPFLAPSLRDFTFIQDGNPSHVVVDGKRILNLEKLKLFGRQLFSILRFQNYLPTYNTDIDPSLALSILSEDIKDEEELYRQSYKYEKISESVIDKDDMIDEKKHFQFSPSCLNINEWTETDVVNFFISLGFEHQAEISENLKTDGKNLVKIWQEKKLDELGFVKIGNTKRVNRLIINLLNGMECCIALHACMHMYIYIDISFFFFFFFFQTI